MKDPHSPISRRHALRQAGLGLAGLAVARYGVNQAQAIANGTLDGRRHPNVGGFVWRDNIWTDDPAPVYIGTATLIHPRVVLSVGHGTSPAEAALKDGSLRIENLLISFAEDATNPSTWRAIDRVITHPDYSPDGPSFFGSDPVPVADVGVAILKKPVRDLPITELPCAGFLDRLKATRQLRTGPHASEFTAVGYGAVADAQGNEVWPPDGRRRVTQCRYNSLNDRWLFLDHTPTPQYGGTLDGDSGGPTYWVDPLTGRSTLVAVTSDGTPDVDFQYRIDTIEVLSFVNRILRNI